jgi:hypothetical protein
MWITLIATAIAAAVCLSAVNLASEINKIRDARNAPSLEYGAPSNMPRLDRSVDTTRTSELRSVNSSPVN